MWFSLAPPIRRRVGLFRLCDSFATVTLQIRVKRQHDTFVMFAPQTGWRPGPTWVPYSSPGAATTTGNSIYDNVLMGIYTEAGVSCVQSYVVSIKSQA